jgi:hypothetical protein
VPIVTKVTDRKRKSKFDEPLVDVTLTCCHEILVYADVEPEVGDTVYCEICSIVKGLNPNVSTNSKCN